MTIAQSRREIAYMGGRLRVQYASVDLHQRAERVSLDELNVVIPASRAGTRVQIEYFATARNTRGRFEGSFEVEVPPDLLPVATLLDATDGNAGYDDATSDD